MTTESGKQYILKTLTESSDPWKAILEVQNTLSLGGIEGGRWNPCLAFLDEIGCSRNIIYFHLLENMKNRLMKSFENKSEEHLSEILKACIPLIATPELRSIPLYIIKKLPIVPKKYLSLLAKHNYLGELPLHVQRYAWEINDAAFQKEIAKPCETLLQQYSSVISLSSNRVMGNAVTSMAPVVAVSREEIVVSLTRLKEIIGQSEILFFKFCVYCHDQSSSMAAAKNKMIANITATEASLSIGDSDQLDNKVDNGSNNASSNDNSSSWGRVVIEMVVKLQEYQSSSSSGSGSSISSATTYQQSQSYRRRFGKTVEFALLLDTIRRQQQQNSISHQQQITNRSYTGSSSLTSTNSASSSVSSIDEGKLFQIFRYLKSFVFAQASELEKRSTKFADQLKRVNAAATAAMTASTSNSSASTSIHSFLKGGAGGVVVVKSKVTTYTKPPRTQQQQQQSSIKSKLTDGERAQAECIKSILLEAVGSMMKLDATRVFADKVTDDIAPGYSHIILHPMDLSLIRKKLYKPMSPAAQYAYLSFDALDADMCLMFDNCIDYNGLSSYYGGFAAELKDKWKHNIKPGVQRLVKQLLQQHEQQMQQGQQENTTATSSSSYSSQQPPSLQKSVVQSQPSSSVSSSSAGVVKAKRQRTAATKKSRYRDYDSDEEQEDFIDEEEEEEDLYNEKGDDTDEEDNDNSTSFLKQSKSKTNKKKKLKRNRMNENSDGDDDINNSESDSDIDDNRDYKRKHASKYSSSSSSSTSKFKITKPAAATATTKTTSIATSTTVPQVATTATKRDRQALLEAHFNTAWNIISKMDSKEGIFAFPVSDAVAPSYSKEILHPMDLQTMRHNVNAHVYKDLSSFDADMCLMLDNCVLYNGEYSAYGVLAKKMKKAWEKERKKIESSREVMKLNNHNSSSSSSVAAAVDMDNNTAVATAATATAASVPTAVTSNNNIITNNNNNGNVAASQTQSSENAMKKNDDAVTTTTTTTVAATAAAMSPESQKPLIKRKVVTVHSNSNSNSNSGESTTAMDIVDTAVTAAVIDTTAADAKASTTNTKDSTLIKSRTSQHTETVTESIVPTLLSSSSSSTDVVTLSTTAPPAATEIPAVPVVKPKTYTKEEMAVILSECLQHLIDTDTLGLFAFPNDAKSQDDDVKMDLAAMRIKVERGKYRRQQLQSAAAAAVLSFSSSATGSSQSVSAVTPVTAVDVMDKDVQNMVQGVLSLCTDLKKRHYCTNYLREWKRYLIQKGLKTYPSSPDDDDDEGNNGGDIGEGDNDHKSNTTTNTANGDAAADVKTKQELNKIDESLVTTTMPMSATSSKSKRENDGDKSLAIPMIVNNNDDNNSNDSTAFVIVKARDITASTSEPLSIASLSTAAIKEENKIGILSVVIHTVGDAGVTEVAVAAAAADNNIINEISPSSVPTTAMMVQLSDDNNSQNILSAISGSDGVINAMTTTTTETDDVGVVVVAIESVSETTLMAETTTASADNIDTTTSSIAIAVVDDNNDNNNNDNGIIEDKEQQSNDNNISMNGDNDHHHHSMAVAAVGVDVEAVAVVESSTEPSTMHDSFLYDQQQMLLLTQSQESNKTTMTNAINDHNDNNHDITSDSDPNHNVVKSNESITETNEVKIEPLITATTTATTAIDSAVVLKFKRPKTTTATTSTSAAPAKSVIDANLTTTTTVPAVHTHDGDDSGNGIITTVKSSSNVIKKRKSDFAVRSEPVVSTTSSSSSSESTVVASSSSDSTVTEFPMKTTIASTEMWNELVMSSALDAIEVLRQPISTTTTMSSAVSGSGNGAMVELPGLMALTGTHYTTSSANTAVAASSNTVTATATATTSGGGMSATTAVGTGNQLSWALLMLRSDGLQSAILSYLGSRLKTTTTALNFTQPTTAAGATSITGILSCLNTATQQSMSVTHRSLPQQDRGVRMALQLLQLSFPSPCLLSSSSSSSSSSLQQHSIIAAEQLV